VVQGEGSGGKDHVRRVRGVLGGEDAENVPFRAVEKPVVKQWYALVLAATTLPFMRNVPSSMNPDRLCGRVLVSPTF
jgi:hypothetical protein